MTKIYKNVEYLVMPPFAAVRASMRRDMLSIQPLDRVQISINRRLVVINSNTSTVPNNLATDGISTRNSLHKSNLYYTVSGHGRYLFLFQQCDRTINIKTFTFIVFLIIFTLL